jgi:hypothetical protein
MFKKPLIWAVILLVSWGAPTWAQSSPDAPVVEATAKPSAADEQSIKDIFKESKLSPELKKRALLLGEEIAASISGLGWAENRIRMRLLLGTILIRQEVSKPQAQAAFQSAIADYQEMVTALIAQGEQGLFDQNEIYLAVGRLRNVREEMIRSFAERDPALALNFLLSSRSSIPKTNIEENQESYEDNLIVNLAAQIAAKDPQQAFELAEQLLQKPEIPIGVLSLLYQLQNKKPELATQLLRDSIARAMREDIVENEMARNFAFALLQGVYGLAEAEKYATKPKDDKKNSSNKNDKEAKLVIDAKQVRELVEKVVTTSLNLANLKTNNLDYNKFSTAQSVVQQLQSLLPIIEKYSPTRLAAVKSKITSFKLDTPSEDAQLYANGAPSSEDLLKFSEKKKNPNYIYQAISTAIYNESPERARELIGRYIDAPVQQREMLNQVVDRQILAAVDKRDFDQLRGLLAQVPSRQRRFDLLIQAITSLISNQDEKVKNIQLLADEAAALLNGELKTQRQLLAHIQLANLSTRINPARSFELLDRVVDRANEVVNALLVLDGFGINAGNEYSYNGELAISQGLFANYTYAFMLLQDLAYIDLERCLSIADRLQNNELRVLVKTYLLNSLLGNRNLNFGFGEYEDDSHDDEEKIDKESASAK